MIDVVVFKCMLLSLSRRFLFMLLAVGVLSYTPTVSASDYDGAQEVRKSKKKKKGHKKQSEEDYWDEDTWDDDEVEAVVKKKKKSGKRGKGKSKKKGKAAQKDGWDDVTSPDEVTSDDAEDFFREDAPVKPVPAAAELQSAQKTAMGKVVGAAPSGGASAVAKKPVADSRAACIEQLCSSNPGVDFIELNVIHPSWTAPVRINKEHMVLVSIKARMDAATVLLLTERELHVKWDQWGEERFLRQADGSYMKDTLAKRVDHALSRKAKRTAARLLGRKAVPWDEYGWSGRIMDYICGNEPPLTYETFRLVSEGMDAQVRFAEAENVLVRMDGEHAAAAVLDYTGVKLHVRWENGEVETYKRLEDGSYRRIDDARVAHQLLDSDKAKREKAEDDWFQIWWRDVTDEEKPLSYVTVEMSKGKETYTPRISMDNRVLIQTPPHQGWAKVIKYDRKQLIIRWDGKREELYERGGDNVYYFVN